MLDGRDFDLRRWQRKASRHEYDRRVGEWMAGGRQLPSQANDLSVTEISAA
jgi:hypothetical protein